MNQDVAKYNQAVESLELRAVCEQLAKIINACMPATVTNKIWHAQPVWFMGNNPLVGYNVTKKGKVNLLFWSGQAFKEPGLTPEGSFKAAEIKYENASEIDQAKLKKWLNEAAVTMYDYKDIRKNRGKLSLMSANDIENACKIEVSNNVKPKKTKVVNGFTIKYHANGKTMWSKGKMLNGLPHGYWEWYRPDGIKKRSGYFNAGKPVGEWTTYDQAGKLFKVTTKNK